MKILVRLPNWLGDMVMSVGFLHQLPKFFPGAELSVIAKKGIHELLDLFPPLQHRFIFSKDEYSGMKGLIRFGQTIRPERFDLFFCLPDSLSAAVMGAASGANKRIGYKKELRQLLLTHAYAKPAGLHRVEEYTRLLQLFTAQPAQPISVALKHASGKGDHVIVNINSEASSRRLTPGKAASLLNGLRSAITQKIVLIGAPKEREFVSSVLSQVGEPDGFENAAGVTSLPQLADLLSSAQLMLTTDSGPAHLANALGTHTIVLFGAGNERNTAPYNEQLRTIIRLGELSCEPCQKNTCVRFGIPQCLERLPEELIIDTVKRQLHG